MTTADASVPLMNLHFSELNEAQTVTTVMSALEEGRGGWLCPVNLDVLRQCAESEGLLELVRSADLVVADGAPLLWASRVAGNPLPERVAGSSLLFTISADAAKRGSSTFLLGGTPGAAEGAAKRLGEMFPGLEVAGTLCPAFGFHRHPEAVEAVVEAVVRSGAQIVFVGLGFPKQDHFIADHLRPALPGMWFVSCGISLSFASGDIARAPAVVQRAGLEWLHRLLHEPRRLYRRYLVEGPPFAVRLLSAALGVRVRGRGRLGRP